VWEAQLFLSANNSELLRNRNASSPREKDIIGLLGFWTFNIVRYSKEYNAS
jgi:hypothetical protein